jgi:hypothetical protein
MARVKMRPWSPGRPHPQHTWHEQDMTGAWVPGRPVAARGWVGWRERRRCRKTGGHWLHHQMGTRCEYYCCQCGAETTMFGGVF